jgi:hypothetical protein
VIAEQPGLPPPAPQTEPAGWVEIIASPPEARQPAPPEALRALQEGFGGCAREPLDFATGRMRCRSERFDAATVEGILPRGGQPPSERLAIYNEQYWYRLLTVLQENYPLVARLLGYWEFNRIATDYLHLHPSRAPYLEGLPWGFPAFLKSRYGQAECGIGAADARLIRSAEIDLAAFRAFHAPGLEPLDPRRLSPEAVECLGTRPLILQPWLTLVEEEEGLVECRRLVLEGHSGLPDIEIGKNHWAALRRDGAVAWTSLSPTRFRLLSLLSQGETLERACDIVAEQLPEMEAQRFADSLGSWFAEWTGQGWFALPEIGG